MRSGIARAASLVLGIWLVASVAIGGSAGILGASDEAALAAGPNQGFEAGRPFDVQAVGQAPAMAPVTQNFSPTADTYVRDILENTNEGNAPFLRITNLGNNRALVRFDQAAIQGFVGGGTVVSAKLRLTIVDNNNLWGSGGRPVAAHRLNKTWVEGNGFVSEAPSPNRGTGSGATYECATDSNIANHVQDCNGATAWNMDNPTQWPFVSAPTDTETIANGQTGAKEWDVTADVVAFNSGSATNFGWIVKKVDENQPGMVKFASRQSGNASARPVLVITVNPAATATPTATNTATATASASATATATASATATSTATETATPTATATETATPTVTATATFTPTTTANPDSYTATGNVFISVAAPGVLANDSPGTVTSFGPSTGGETPAGSTGTSSGGGIVAVNSVGSFTYNPPTGFTGADSFKYTLNGIAVGTVTITVNDMVWFVNNAPGACTTACDGRLSHPYTSLAAFVADNDGVGLHPDDGQVIFVYTGSGPYASAIPLRAGQKLIGQGADLTGTLGQLTPPITPAPNSATLPAQGASPTISGTVTLSGSSVVTGLDISAATSTGLAGGSVSGVTVGPVGSAGGPVNVTTTTGTAVSLVGTAGTVSLVSVNAGTSGSGPTNGILLNGTSGSFTVTGTGGVCTAAVTSGCTGGTIQQATGDGVSLTSASNVSLTRMLIQNNARSGILGTSVSGVTLNTSVLLNNTGSDPSAANRYANLRFDDLTGTSSITNSEVAGAIEDNARITNHAGTLSLTVTGSVFRDTAVATPGNAGLRLIAGEVAGDAPTITADITGSTFTNNRARGIQGVTNAGGTLSLTVGRVGTVGSGGTFTGNLVAFDIANNSSSSDLRFHLSQATITQTAPNIGPGVNIFLGAASTAATTLRGTISNNTITGAGDPCCDGISAVASGAGTATLAITDNVITNLGLRGMTVQAGQGTNTVNATITGNTVTVASGVPDAGIFVTAATNNVASTMCATVGSSTNAALRNTIDTTSTTRDVRAENRFALSTFQLPGYTGLATDMTAVASYLDGRNTIVPPGGSSATRGLSGAGFLNTPGGVDCAVPPAAP